MLMLTYSILFKPIFILPVIILHYDITTHNRLFTYFSLVLPSAMSDKLIVLLTIVIGRLNTGLSQPTATTVSLHI